MLERARQNAEKSNASNVTFVEATITSIPLQASTADCIISNCVINLVPEADKPVVFQEIFRLLKPGGRVSISDILAKVELPPDIKNDMALYVGCIAGASQVKDYEKYLNEAGFEGKISLWPSGCFDLPADKIFEGTLIIDKHSDLNLYKETDLGDKSTQQKSSTGECCSTSCCNPEPTKAERSATAIADYDLNEWVGKWSYGLFYDGKLMLTRVEASFQIYAVKPNH